MALKRLVQAGLTLIAALFATAQAALAAPCGVSSTPVTVATTDYDPFNPTGLGTTSFTLNITRVNQPGGAHTSEIRFYLQSTSSGANGTTIVPVSAVPSANMVGGVNIFYNFGATPPTLTGNPTSGNRFVLILTTGNNAESDNVQVTFNVTLPPNLDLTASQNLQFDLVYACLSAGGGDPGAGTNPNAVTFPIRVLSALQASFVGPALDFGEVGNLSTATVTGSPATYTRIGNVRVASSGPYNVTLASANGYRMTYPGGNPATANQRLNYNLSFLGQSRAAGSASTITAACQRATLAGELLPIRIVLQEGGDTKTPAANYSDTLTVTVVPQVTLPSTSDCSAL